VLNQINITPQQGEKVFPPHEMPNKKTTHHANGGRGFRRKVRKYERKMRMVMRHGVFQDGLSHV
jgi:hypothetical protein